MNGNPPVVVNKQSGFLAAAMRGLFGFLTATVVCASAIGFYALWVVNSQAGDLIATGRAMGVGLLEQFPEWRASLPPILEDAVNDRRDPQYRRSLAVSGEVHRDDEGVEAAVVRVTNDGSETVSLLMARITFLDEAGTPVRECMETLATPLALDDEDWPGPILPGSTRVVSVERYRRGTRTESIDVEITELRLWNSESVPAAPAEKDLAKATD